MSHRMTEDRGMVFTTAGRVGARAASSVMLGITLLVIAHGTSVAAFGTFMAAYTVGLIVGIAVGAGAPTRVLRSAGDADAENVPAVYVTHSLSVIAVFGAVGVLWLVAGWPVAIIAGGVFALSDTLQNYAQSHLAGVGMHSSASWLIVTQRAVPLAVAVATFGSISLAWTAVGFAISAVIALVAPFPSMRFELAQNGARAVGSWSFWLYSLSGILVMTQIPVVGVLFSTTVLGYFALATRVIGPITLLSASVSSVVIPEMTRRIASGGMSTLYGKYRLLSYSYLAVTVAAAWPLATGIVWFLGDKYLDAVALLVGMTIGAGLSGCSQAANALLIAAGQPSRATVAITGGGVIALVIIAALAAMRRPDLLWLAPIVAETVVLGLMTWSARAVLADLRVPTSVGAQA